MAEEKKTFWTPKKKGVLGLIIAAVTGAAAGVGGTCLVMKGKELKAKKAEIAANEAAAAAAAAIEGPIPVAANV